MPPQLGVSGGRPNKNLSPAAAPKTWEKALEVWAHQGSAVSPAAFAAAVAPVRSCPADPISSSPWRWSPCLTQDL